MGGVTDGSTYICGRRQARIEMGGRIRKVATGGRDFLGDEMLIVAVCFSLEAVLRPL